MCAIISSTVTLAAYFGAFDLASRSLAAAHAHAGAIFDARTINDPALFPPGLGELLGVPAASS